MQTRLVLEIQNEEVKEVMVEGPTCLLNIQAEGVEMQLVVPWEVVERLVHDRAERQRLVDRVEGQHEDLHR